MLVILKFICYTVKLTHEINLLISFFCPRERRTPVNKQTVLHNPKICSHSSLNFRGLNLIYFYVQFKFKQTSSPITKKMA